jgi:hypothetical protein
MNEPYTREELEEIRTQAIWFPTDVGCPRHRTRMMVVKTFVFQMVSRTGTKTEVLHKRLDGWPVLAGWDREEVELACDECGANALAKTGPVPQRTWANTLAKVLEGVQKRGCDPRIVESDQRSLKVTIQRPVGGREKEKFAASITWADLAMPAETLAARVLAQYDRHVTGKDTMPVPRPGAR